MSQLVISEMIEYFKDDIPRINHALKVYGFAQAIAALESAGAETAEIINLTAILHDIGIKECERKYSSTAGKYQEIEGPPVAKKIMEKLNINNDMISRVNFIIAHHHDYEKIDGLDFQILIEADFIVNAFEKNLAAEAVDNFTGRYFKTEGGRRLIKSMYAS